MDLEKSAVAVPGWYVDPEHPGSERYWDGQRWTDQRRPAQARAAPSASSNGFAVTALVCGIVGAVLGVLPFFVGWILGIIAIVFGVLARKRAEADPAIGRKGMATAGIVLGIIAIVASIVWVLIFALLVDTTSTFVNDINYCLEHPKALRCD